MRHTADVFGPPDILVNNTGINPVYGPLLELDLAAARKIFEVNVLGTLGWVQEVLRRRQTERGAASSTSRRCPASRRRPASPSTA